MLLSEVVVLLVLDSLWVGFTHAKATAHRGKPAIESKESVRSTLGHSLDLAESLMLCLGQHFEVPRLKLAPSDSWAQARDPMQYNDSCELADAEADGIYGNSSIRFVRRSKSKWDSFLN
jgi:hypothetical protein